MKRLIFFFCMCALVTSCMTQKKWAQGCAERFPVREQTVYLQGETKYDTTYLQPDTLVFTDTVTVDCDTVKGIVTKYVYQQRPCPPGQVHTAFRVDTFEITKVDSAAIRVAQITADEQRQRADRVNGGRNTWRGIAVVCLLIIIGAAIFSKVKGFI